MINHVMKLKNKWGFNYPLVLNLIVLFLILLLITTATKSDGQIIDESLNQSDELSFLKYQFGFSEDTEIEDINPIYTNIKNKISSMNYINQSKTKYSLYHSTTLQINKDDYNYSNIFYVSSSIWEEITMNRSYTGLLTNIPMHLQNESEYVINPEYEDRELYFDDTNISISTTIPQFLNEISGITTVDLSDLSLSLFRGPILVMPLPDILPVLTELETNQNWQFIGKFYILSNILQEIDKISTVKDFVIKANQTLHGIHSSYYSSSMIFSELLNYLETSRREAYEKISNNMVYFVPAILAIQICFLYFLHIIIKRLYEQFDLLHARGYSISGMRRSLSFWYAGLPSGLFTLLLVMTSHFKLFNEPHREVILKFMIPWLILQFFTLMFLIYYNIRQFRIKSLETQYQISQFDFKWYKFIGLVVFALAIITLIKFITFDNTYFDSIHDIDDVPQYFISLNWFMIFLIIFCFLVTYEIIIPSKLGSRLDIKFSFNQLYGKNGISILIIFVLILSMGFLSFGTMQSSIEGDGETLAQFDYTGNFRSYSHDNPVYFKHNLMQKIDGLTSYMLEYRPTISLVGKNYDFTSLIKIYNQSLYDSFECDCTNSEDLFGETIWINQELYDFMFKNSESTTISQLDEYNSEETENLEIKLYQENFSILDPQSTIRPYNEGTIDIFASVETFQSMGFHVNWPIAPSIFLNFEDSESITDEVVLDRISKYINLNGNQLKIIDRSDEKPSSNDYELVQNTVQIGNFTTVVLVGLLFTLVVTRDNVAIEELNILIRRFGDNKIVNQYLIFTTSLALIIGIVSLLGAFCFSLVLGPYFIIYSNGSYQIEEGYNLFNNLLVNLPGLSVMVGIVAIGVIIEYIQISDDK